MALRIGKKTNEESDRPVDLPPPDTESSPRRGLSPKVLALGGILLLAVAGGAYMILAPGSGEEELTDDTAASLPAPSRPARTPAPVAGTPRPAGAPSGDTSPGIMPAEPGKAPRLVPGPGVPTPVQPPKNMMAQPGKRIERGATKIVGGSTRPRAATAPSPAVLAKLKSLWKQGAEAKRRKDFNAARQLWQQAAELAYMKPGLEQSHRAIQEAINKLPK